MARTIIVGASHGGVTAAEALQRNGYDGEILLFSAENVALPYHRPPLSKAYLSGEKTAQQIALRGEKFYADNAVGFLPGARVTGIDAARREIVAAGRGYAYDNLILATGARPRPLPASEAITTGLMSLRTMADADRLAARRKSAGRLVIAGGGFIGLEVAATFAKAGAEVIVVEPLPALLRRALPPGISEHLLARHRAEGVDIRLETTLQELHHTAGRLTGVTLSDGSRIATDDLLVGIGSTARLELAEMAGLRLDRGGIRTGAFGQTSTPGIWAIGDCATQENRFAGGAVRIESVQAATDQARATGAKIAGAPAPASAFEALPWFWSDQYDMKLQMTGFVTPGAETILRGTPGDGAFSVLQLRDDRLLSCFSVNRAVDHIQARKLIPDGGRLDPAGIADPAMPLRACLISEATE